MIINLLLHVCPGCYNPQEKRKDGIYYSGATDEDKIVLLTIGETFVCNLGNCENSQGVVVLLIMFWAKMRGNKKNYKQAIYYGTNPVLP